LFEDQSATRQLSKRSAEGMQASLQETSET